MTDHTIRGIGSPPEVYERMHGDEPQKITINRSIWGFDENHQWRELESVTVSEYEIPPVGSRWFNNRRKKVFTVAGLVAHCEDEGAEVWEVLYRSDDMPEGHYRRRSLESWYGDNRDGQPRFVRLYKV